MSRTIPNRICGCAGCRAEAAVVIDHPDYGKRVVCTACADGFEAIRDV
jgi:hypothetical protein